MNHQTTPPSPSVSSSISSNEDLEIESKDVSSELIIGIPAYNEEVGIGSIVLAARQYTENVFVIDDGSTDRTAEIARQAGAIVIEHEENFGKGHAIQSLFERVRLYNFDALVMLDGDGQHAPRDIPEVIEPIVNGQSDLVIGSRYMGGRNNETPLYRRFGQQVLDLLTGSTIQANLTDTQSGFRAFSPEAVQSINIKTGGMAAESEMINTAAQQNLDIEERPIGVRYDVIDGQTYNPVQHGLGVTLFLLRLIRDRHPLLFFGLPGLILTLSGTLYGLNLIVTYQNTGAFYPASASATGIITIIGILGIFCGLVLNRISNMVKEIEQSITDLNQEMYSDRATLKRQTDENTAD